MNATRHFVLGDRVRSRGEFQGKTIEGTIKSFVGEVARVRCDMREIEVGWHTSNLEHIPVPVVPRVPVTYKRIAP